VISVIDDGAGIDLQAVLRRAKERGLVEESVADLTLEQAVELIFSPSFSTAQSVTSIAGRGVGLDVVKQEIESMNGSVAIETTPGLGSIWKLIVPLSLAVTEAVVVKLGGNDYAVPLNYVAYGLLIQPDRITIREGVEWYSDGALEYRLVRMHRLFGTQDPAAESRGLIVSAGDQRLILAVDSVPSRREIVVKPLDSLVARHPFFEGGTLDNEGRPVLIMNIPSIIRLAVRGKLDALLGAGRSNVIRAGAGSGMALGVGTKPVVLVVDDSLSVRTVQQRILTDLDCEVILANDGMDAVEVLRTRAVNFIFSDLEMPRMNGYDLTTTVRTNPNWSHIPVVIVTSRAAQKHIDKAMQLGASACLTKPFTQEDLRRMLDTHIRYQQASAA
jgi:chemosensory pili system protein ChpA (sensor histidine kinase/response regulator)